MYHAAVQMSNPAPHRMEVELKAPEGGRTKAVSASVVTGRIQVSCSKDQPQTGPAGPSALPQNANAGVRMQMGASWWR